jgi:alpha-glucosidase
LTTSTNMAPLSSLLCASLALAGSAVASSLSPIYPRQNSTTPDCPGYRASDVKTTANGLSAKLTLAGTPCIIYGTDLEDLTLTVEYQTGEWNSRYLSQVPKALSSSEERMQASERSALDNTHRLPHETH